jgi:hypothetical protein
MKIKEYLLNEKIFDMSAIVGNKKITKPVSAKNDDDAIKQFQDFLKIQIKYGHIKNGKIKNVKIN